MKNPYTERFALTPADIKRLSAHHPRPLLHLSGLLPQEAVNHIEGAHQALFVPTQQTAALLECFVACARAHCELLYSDLNLVGAQMMAEARPGAAYLPICLTGLAGTGKSALLEALMRVLAKQAWGDAGGAVHAFPLQAAVRVKLRKLVSNTEFLKTFVDAIGPRRFACPSPDKELAHKLYAYAVCLAVADEFQFVTGSTQANVRAVQILLLLSTLQVPQVFAVNYSMCHRLMARPQEERDRVFSRVLLLRPELPDTPDWTHTVKGYVDLIPNEFEKLKIEELASTVYPLTFGLKRQLAKLIRLAYLAMRQDGRNQFTLGHFDKAYRSNAYAAAREDVHLLLQQAAVKSTVRRDLSCPFSEIEDKKAQTPSSVQSAFGHVVAKAMVEGTSSRTPSEAKAAPRPRVRSSGSKEPKGNVVSMEERRGEALEASMAVLSQGLKLK
jgi:hypothetical protein